MKNRHFVAMVPFDKNNEGPRPPNVHETLVMMVLLYAVAATVLPWYLGLAVSRETCKLLIYYKLKRVRSTARSAARLNRSGWAQDRLTAGIQRRG